jgi:site-specific DNA-methyltransferase (adenine-specific)
MKLQTSGDPPQWAEGHWYFQLELSTKHYTTTAGAIYMRPTITLNLGDCVQGMKAMPDNSFDYCFTDPPYNVNYRSNHRKKKLLGTVLNDHLPPDQFQDLMHDAFGQVKRLLKPGAVLHVCGGWSTADQILPVLKAHFTVKACIVWDKVHLGVGWWVRYRHEFVYVLVNGHRSPPIAAHRLPDIWPIPRPPTNNRLHVCEKPRELVMRAMGPFTEPGHRVLDPFMGSAPVAEACWITGRDFVGWELDQANFTGAVTRMRRIQAEFTTAPDEFAPGT